MVAIAKSVETFLKDGEKINLFETAEAREEAEIIADEIFNGRIEGKIPYHDHAVLCRTNTQMRTFEEVFRQKNIPYRLIGGFSFFDPRLCWRLVLLKKGMTGFHHCINRIPCPEQSPG